MSVLRNCGMIATRDMISGSCTSSSQHDWYTWACLPHMFVSIRHPCTHVVRWCVHAHVHAGTIHNCIPKPGRLTGNAKKPSNQSPHSCFWRASISLLMKLLGKPTTNSVATCMYGTMWFEPKNTQLAGSVASRAQVIYQVCATFTFNRVDYPKVCELSGGWGPAPSSIKPAYMFVH